ncbi:extracellular solute-binding protein [Shewanella sp. D64]|uniref:substrate-binding domain-containing protein n=1 Tax=unclassified Shewanella TaxID=196818 RepID=UPI0022BA46B8|nr:MULTISPECIES: substrate-binding domain-containing protein [unclassified Shewanella]MEC4727582.1 extracellular solute-binding protein [Shewanella sp. D64]MEC4739833.1 extracellular solute-binding protein [Shewanella sp. E94]WBJ95781.1 extracellular solute-binding protein [Shewanella sp. MTB7]
MLNLKSIFSLALAATLMTAMPVQAEEVIKLATTTSTDNSGLLNNLLPKFEAETGYKVQVIATGTGKALKLASQGDVDVIMTHAPAAEAKFVDEGFGLLPRGIMENDFVILGPKNDPAKIRSSKTVEEAFAKIAESGAPFISRGDNSGTNMKELIIWKNANIDPTFSGYKSVGQGMGKTLLMADEFQGYTLSDRGTFVAYKAKLDMAIDFDGGEALANPYQIMLINPAKYPELNHKGARALSDWLISAEAQGMINSYKVHGEQLFKATYSE